MFLQLDNELAFLWIMVKENNNLQFTNEVAKALKDRFEKESFSSVFVLVDDNTNHHCLPLIEKSLPVNHQLIQIKSGEANKTIATCQSIWQFLTDANADRHALIINLGGGVICDMGGFCARTYKRGIHFWNIPTTLLSQVDASVGGKLGVDFGVFKNHIGLFSDPDLVIIDSGFFNTLPQDEIISGYAEMVKHALIKDRIMFNELTAQNVNDLDWHSWVLRSVAIKKVIVEEDPTENGLRKILNFGHTVGHAVESYFMDKGNALKHGEAIAIGMIAETYLSCSKHMLVQEEGDRIIEYLLEVFPKKEIANDTLDDIVNLAFQDKKNKNGKIYAVLLKALGEAVYDTEINADEIRKSLIYYNQLTK